METQTRRRPELPPVYTGREQPTGYLRPSPYSATGPLYSASVSLPSPMHNVSPGYGQAMRAHERALLARLGPRGRREAQGSPATARSLSPISEQSSSTRRASVASLPTACAPVSSSPGLAQCSPLAATAREILLAGMPDGPHRLMPATGHAIAGRRQSLPLSTANANARRSNQQLWAEIKAWDRLFCVVSAVPLHLRRPSDSSSADEGGAQDKPSVAGNRVTIRARVRPCALNRRPFLLKRTFDRDALRPSSPGLPPASARLRRPSTELTSRSRLPASRRRSPVVVNGEHGSGLDWSSVQSTNTVPIHMKYARKHFPLLAALLYSRHIQPGDIIDLPLPCPEAWGQTVAYVYTAEGEPTEAMKQNILYLGGKS